MVTVEGVRFVDNSKATNPHASIAAVGDGDGVVLIAGGDAKGVDLSPLGSPRLSGVVAIGAAARQIRSVFEGRVVVRDATSIEDATRIAFEMAPSGGTVLLAPACASWDMFADYTERGERFAAAARALQKEERGREQRWRHLPTTANPAVGPAGRTSGLPGASRRARGVRSRCSWARPAFLVGSGLVMILSASSVSAFAEYGDSFLFVQRQATYAVVGILALLVTSRMRYDAWKRLAGPFLIVTIAMLVLVLIPTHGIEAYGASRWFRLGPVTVQPSEIAKLALVVFGAATLARTWKNLDDLKNLALPLLPVSVLVCGLVMMQPDLGTTVILAVTSFFLLFAAGVRLRYLTSRGWSAPRSAGLIMSATTEGCASSRSCIRGRT